MLLNYNQSSNMVKRFFFKQFFLKLAIFVRRMEYFERIFPFFFPLFAFWKNFLPGKTLMKIGDYQQENLAKFGYRAYVKV